MKKTGRHWREIQGQMYATENQMEINEAELAEGEAKIQAAIEAQKKAEEEAQRKSGRSC